MKKTIIALLVILTLFGCTISKRIVFLDDGSNAPDQEYKNAAEYEEEYGEHDIVFLEVERNIEHSKEDFIWNYHYINKIKYMIFNVDHERYSTFEFYKSKQTIVENVYMKVTRPDGTFSLYTLADCVPKENSYGGITYKFSYPNLEKGSVIEEAYQISFNSNYVRPDIYEDVRLQYTAPIKKLKFTYNYPDWWKVDVKKNNKDGDPEYDIIYDEEASKISLVYKKSDIPAYKNEPYSPYFKENGDYMFIEVNKLTMGNTVYYGPEDWMEIVKEYENYFMHKDGFLTFRVGSKTKELTENCSSDYEKMVNIITFIQDSVKISDDKALRNFAQVLKNKEGNIPMITGLAYSMLKKADLNVDLYIVHDRRNGYFDKTFFSYFQFDSPILKVNFPDKNYYLVPYLKYLQIGEIPDFFSGQKALKIDETANMSYSNVPTTPTFKMIPLSENSNNIITEDYNLVISEDGNIEIEEIKSFDGLFSFVFREYLKELKDDEIDEEIEGLLTFDEGNMIIDSYEILNLEEYREPLRIKLNYKLDNAVSITPYDIIFQTGGLFSPASIKSMKIDTSKRQNPISIISESEYVKNIKINFPEKWKLATELKKIQYNNKFGYIEKTSSVDGNVLDITQISHLNKIDAPKEEIMELLKLRGKDNALELPSLIFTRVE